MLTSSSLSRRLMTLLLAVRGRSALSTTRDTLNSGFSRDLMALWQASSRSLTTSVTTEALAAEGGTISRRGGWMGAVLQLSVTNDGKGPLSAAVEGSVAAGRSTSTRARSSGPPPELGTPTAATSSTEPDSPSITACSSSTELTWCGLRLDGVEWDGIVSNLIRFQVNAAPFGRREKSPRASSP